MSAGRATDGADAIGPNAVGPSARIQRTAAHGWPRYQRGRGFSGGRQSMTSLRRRLPATTDKLFPHFEALVKVKGRSSQPRDANIAVCRSPRP
jgi:hypothetical protein